MRSLLIIMTFSMLFAVSAVARADCLKEVAALEQRMSKETETPKTGAETGVAVKERGGTTTYPEGGAAQPAESWLGSPPQKGQQVKERLATARRFGEQGDEASCRRELEKARSASSQ
jgi:hypothetical protein